MQLQFPNTQVAHAFPDAVKAPAPMADGSPGMLISTDLVAAHNPALYQRFIGTPLAPRRDAANFLVVPPHQMPFFVRHDNELAFFKSVVKTIAQGASPIAGRVVDGAWILYGLYKLREMVRAGAKFEACFFQFVDVSLSTTALAGQIHPQWKMPDPLANGINFAVATSGAIVEGRAIPTIETGLAQDERNAVALAAMKVLGVSLDDPGSTTLPDWIRPRVAPLATTVVPATVA
jgi:hypothetical protein